jgi:hypothetical protein
MPLDPSFWGADPTKLLKDRRHGHLYLDVVLYRRIGWPEVWTPEAIWHHPDLRDIAVWFIGPNSDGGVSGYQALEVTANWCGKGKHRVEGRFSGWTLGPDEPEMPCGRDALRRRTTLDVDDLAWMFAHWNPERPYPLDEWWREKQQRVAKLGLHADAATLIEMAIEESKGLRTTMPSVVEGTTTQGVSP